MEEEDNFDFLVKRKREYAKSFKWTTEVLAIFKPTAKKFYQKIIEEYAPFRDAGVQSLKNKMSYCKSQFIKAVEWRNQSGAGLLEEGDGTSVENYLEKICSHFERLHDIFGKRKSVVPSRVVDSFESDLEVLVGYEEIAELNNNSIDMSSTMGTDTEDEPVAKRASSEPPSRKATEGKGKTKSEMQMMQQARLEIEKEKLKWEKEKFGQMQQSQIKMDKEKLDWEKSKRNLSLNNSKWTKKSN
ncbi:uncharacterized protein [Drosophila takahashii]|uniref:uncharacterized protein n=1 Tax=Drosophila takahashii TaxID=29030 RepID=UPI0038994D5D